MLRASEWAVPPPGASTPECVLVGVDSAVCTKIAHGGVAAGEGAELEIDLQVDGGLAWTLALAVVVVAGIVGQSVDQSLVRERAQ